MFVVSEHDPQPDFHSVVGESSLLAAENLHQDPYHVFKKIQHRTARFVCNNYSMYDSVSSMLDLLNWPSLEHT